MAPAYIRVTKDWMDLTVEAHPPKPGSTYQLSILLSRFQRRREGSQFWLVRLRVVIEVRLDGNTRLGEAGLDPRLPPQVDHVAAAYEMDVRLIERRELTGHAFLDPARQTRPI